MSRTARTGLLLSFGAFGAAAMLSATAAPTARADDFAEIISSVEGDFTTAASDFNSAFSNLGSGELAPGFAAFLDGVNSDLLSAPENLLMGTAEVLDNESVSPPEAWNLVPEATFAGGLSQAEADFAQGENFFTQAVGDLSGGEYGYAVAADLSGLDLASVAPVDDLLLGTLSSL
jgi:hypothetical protein